jgi:hypothetical protein
MDLTDIRDFVTASKAAVDLLKSAYALLPKGTEREEIQNKVKMAEDILARSDAKLARDLGYTLCQCTFPPQIMRWNEKKQAMYCPNEECGREDSFAEPVQFRPDFF